MGRIPAVFQKPTLFRAIGLLTLALSLHASAQSRPARSGIGFKLGPQLASQRAAGYNFQPVPGGVLGMYFPIWIRPRLELQPELLGSMQGSSYDIPDDGGRIVTNTYYLQLPVTAKLFLGNVLNLQGGGYIGQLLAANTDGENTKDAFNGMDAGFILGLGIDMMSGFDLTARYVYGKTNLMRGDDTVFPTTRCLQLTAGWRLMRFKHRTHKLG
jgi:hypothetical protein